MALAQPTILNAAALVWSCAPVIIGAHDTGPLIRSKNEFWLAIPTPAAGKSTRGGQITPGEWERRTGLRLRFIYRRWGSSLLVVEGRLNTKGRGVKVEDRPGRHHRADLSAGAAGAARDAGFDTLCTSIGAAIAADRTPGGLCDRVEAQAPRAWLTCPLRGSPIR